MSLSLNENQKKALITLTNQRFDEHISRFPYAKYPIEPLDQWRMQFADPKNIGPETLRSALTWQKGFWQRKDIPYAQRQIDISVIKAWAEFVQENSPNIGMTLTRVNCTQPEKSTKHRSNTI